jgi:hypothetical protein
MSEHEKETAFLQGVIRYDHTAEHQRLDEEITRLRDHLRVLRRAVFCMVMVSALAVAGLCYAAILSSDYPHNMWRFSRHVGVMLPCALGLASLMCLVGFTGLAAVYRKQLDGLREKARGLAERLLVSHLELRAGASRFEIQEQDCEEPVLLLGGRAA